MSETSTFKPKPGEEHLVHFTAEKTTYDRKTGKKVSNPKLQTIEPQHFKKYKSTATTLGYDITVIHKPKS